MEVLKLKLAYYSLMIFDVLLAVYVFLVTCLFVTIENIYWIFFDP